MNSTFAANKQILLRLTDFAASNKNTPTHPPTHPQVHDVGLVLAHGREPDDCKAPLITALAERLAVQGYVVARVASAAEESEERRTAMYEKTLDAFATSPYAQAVKRWVLAGGHLCFLGLRAYTLDTGA